MSIVTRSDRAVAGLELRYLLTVLLIEAGRRVSLAELVRRVEGDGFTLAGRPSKTVSDALRWELAKGRVLRCGRGIYVTGSMPRQTKSRIRARVNRMRRELVAEKRDMYWLPTAARPSADGQPAAVVAQKRDTPGLLAAAGPL